MKKLFIVALLLLTSFSLADMVAMSGMWFEKNPNAVTANIAAIGNAFTTKNIVAGAHTNELFRLRAVGERSVWYKTTRLVATLPSDCTPTTQTKTFTTYQLNATFGDFRCSTEGSKKITVSAYNEKNELLGKISNSIVINNSLTQCTRYANDFKYVGVSSVFDTAKWSAKTEAGYYIVLANASAGPLGNWKGTFWITDPNKVILAKTTLYSCGEYKNTNLGVTFTPISVFPTGHAVISIAKTGAQACVDSDAYLGGLDKQITVKGTCKDTSSHTDYTVSATQITEHYCKLPPGTTFPVCKYEVVDCLSKGYDSAKDGACVKNAPGNCAKLSYELYYNSNMKYGNSWIAPNGMKIKLISTAINPFRASFEASKGTTVYPPFDIVKGGSTNAYGVLVRVCDVGGTPGSSTAYASVGMAPAGATPPEQTLWEEFGLWSLAGLVAIIAGYFALTGFLSRKGRTSRKR